MSTSSRALEKTGPLSVVNGSPFPLKEALKPLQLWLDQDDVVEICVNCPGVVFVERLGSSSMEFHAVPALTENHIRHIAERVAAFTKQSVNAEKPLLSATLPNGERFQAVLPPAATRGGSITIRKQVVQKLTLDDYMKRNAFSRTFHRYRDLKLPPKAIITDIDKQLIGRLVAADYSSFLREAVRNKYSMVLSGGTSTGKTTFLNMLFDLVPSHERIITIEDVSELKPQQSNTVSMLASKGEQGQSKVSIQTLLESSLRMRPDRIFLGELRAEEAFTFFRAVNTGHPGSITTVHADSTDMAFHQLVLMGLQARTGLQAPEIRDYVKTVIPIVVQLKRWEDVDTHSDFRGVQDIFFSAAEAFR
ncbi:MAG: P-type DNA transfer ATPase VirB11 [Rhizobiaceae bacterium]